MEENYTMQQTSSSEPKKNRKRKWLRSCLIVLFGYFAISLVIVCLFGGSCTIWTIGYIWPRRVKLEDRHFELSPDGREIVYSSVLGIYRESPSGGYIRSDGAHFKKRIPMDPVPDGMFLFTLEVKEDPSQEQAKSKSVPTSKWSSPVPVDYLFPFLLDSIGSDNPVPDYYHNVWPDGTFRLIIHPDDRDKLSQPFCVTVWDNGKAYRRERSILVFPRGKKGNRYEVLTARISNEEDSIPWSYHRVFELQPFEEEFNAIAKKETREDGVKGGWYLVGGAVLMDIAMLPAEVLYWTVRVIYEESIRRTRRTASGVEAESGSAQTQDPAAPESSLELAPD